MAKLIAANYNSTTSTAYGFMTTHNISLKNNTTYTLLCRYKYTKNNSSGPQIILHESSWSAGIFGIFSAHSDMAVSTKVFTAPANAENYSWAIYCYSWSYENQQGTGGKDGVLAVDWYELWEGDVTQFSLTDAIGLSGAGVNLYSGLGGNDYSNLLTSGSGFTNHGIDITTFGFPCQKFTTSTDTGYCYKSESGVKNTYYNLSYDLYSTVEVTDLGSYASGQGHILLSQTTYVPANTWTRVYCTYQATNSNMIALCYPKKVGTYYIKDLKITRCNLECPINYTDASATSNTLPNNFNSIISNVRNSNYFNNTNTNGINSVRNWRGYYYNTNTFIASTSLSTTSVAASGGSITVNYTVKENWTNGKTPTPKAGITPTITSSIGTVSNITATDANGNGTAKITVASRGTTVGAAQTGTVSVSFGGVTKTATFTQALNKVTSVEKLGTPKMTYANIPAGGGTSTPTNSGFTARFYYSSGSYGDPNGYKITHSYSWNGASGTFTALNTSTGVITASTRGTNIGNAVSSPTVTHSAIFEYTNPVEVGGNIVSIIVSGTATCTQEANAVTKVTAVVKDTNVSSAHFTYGAYSSARAIPATGVNNLAVVDNGAAILTFTSGAESDKLTAGNHYGGTLSFSRVFYFNGDPNTLSSDGFTINKTTGALTVTSNPTASARTIYAYGDLTATWGSLSHAITHQRNLKQNAGPVGQKQERAMFYRNPSTSLPTVGIQGGFVFQPSVNTSFSSSTYTLPTSHSTSDNSMGITLTETDSTKASSFYIYMNNVVVAVNSSIQPSVRMHLRVGVKSSATTFTSTWYDQYITPTSIVNQNGVWVATWDTSKYALINIPASGDGGAHCHIDVEFTY